MKHLSLQLLTETVTGRRRALKLSREFLSSRTSIDPADPQDFVARCAFNAFGAA